MLPVSSSQLQRLFALLTPHQKLQVHLVFLANCTTCQFLLTYLSHFRSNFICGKCHDTDELLELGEALLEPPVSSSLAQ